VPSVALFDPLDPDSYNYSTSLTLYDSQGSSHVGSMYFVKSSTPNEWEAHFRIIGDDDINLPADADSDPDLIPVDINGGASYTLVFDNNGALIDPTNDPGELSLGPVTVDNGVAPMSMIWDLTDTTQFGASFAVNELDQDGYSTGRLNGVDIDDEGVVFARYTNGESAIMGKVAIANFNNPQGLRNIGGTKWAESFEAGTVRFGEAGTSNFGLMQSGALESSNVDIASELVNLILAQRNFQANAKVISTSDQITQSIINLR
jgi:flagellar hook protein FlgE